MKKKLVSLSVFLVLVLSLIPGYSRAAVTTGALSQDGALYDDLVSTEKCRKGELLVKFKSSASAEAKQKVHDKHGSKVVKEFPHLRMHHVKVNAELGVIEAMARYQSEPDVEYVEPNYRVAYEGIPNDLRFSELWGLFNTGQTGGAPGADIDAPNAWSITTGSGNVVVAVIDSGVDYTHNDLAANMWINQAEYNGVTGVDDDNNGYIDDLYGINVLNHTSNPMDDNGHGTHVSGIIGAIGDNSIGVTGVNWGVKMLACKFLNANGEGFVDGAIECLQYVRKLKDKGVNIIATNNSWGSDGYSQALYDAINAQKEILFFASAGNKQIDLTGPLSHYPAKYYLPNIVAAMATDKNDDKAWFSNFGRRTVHVGAPGDYILSTLPNNNYDYMSGTSMSTAHVTGLAALIKSQNANRDWIAVKNLILSGGDAIPSMTDKTITGKRINAYGSLTCGNRPVFSALKFPSSLTAGVSSTLSALSINCEAAVGPVTLTTLNGEEVIQLYDGGITPDLAAGDGIFTGKWTPSRIDEALTFSSSAGTETIAYVLLISTKSLPFGTTGVAYNQTLTAVGGKMPYTWSVSSGTLPAGFALDPSTGVISGTPTTTGTSTFTVQVKDASAAITARDFSLTVYDPLVVTTQTLTFGTVGVAYSQTLAATGGKASYTWSLAAGSVLPSGLSLDPATGVISGTPTASGPYKFTVQVVDANSTTVTQPLSIDVYDPIVVSTQTLTFGTVGVAYSQTLEATGGKTLYTWSLAAGSVLPGGLSLDPSTGVISGTPTTAETANFTVQVTDANATTASKAFSIVVYTPLIISTQSPLPWGMTNTPYNQTLAATGGKTSYAWSLATGSLLPAGLTLNTAAGMISGTPTAPGAFTFTVQATDANATTAEKSISITLYDSPIKPDLVVSVLSVPSTGGTGKSIIITDTTMNNGPGAIAASTTGFYFSAKSSIDSTAVLLNSRSVPALIPGAVATGSTTVTIPTATASGNYYIIAKADSGNAVAELNESNNTALSFIQIGSDLSVSSLTAPSTGGAGKSITVTDTTKNEGPGDAGATTTSIYFSAKSSIDSTAVLLDSRPVSALAAGAKDIGSTTVTIPSGAAPGNYYLIAKADSGNAVKELSESNNTAIWFIQIGSDLSVSSLTAPSTGGAGKSITVTDTTMNEGPGDAGATTTSIYFSAKSSIDSTAVLLDSRPVPALAAGAKDIGSTTVTIPSGTAPGNYFIIARADDGNAVKELSESNNTAIWFIQISTTN